MTRVKPFRPVALVIALAAGLLAAGPAGAAPPAGAPQREPAQVDERVTADLEKDGKADVWAVFGERTDLTGADAIDDWDAKGQYVYDRLTATADASQASARKQLETAGADFEPFWISNRILVRGADEALTGQIAAMDGVEKVTASVELANEKPTPAEAEAGLDAVEWGIAAINADDVWAQFGSRGDGLVVANIDSGVQWDHPALRAAYRGSETGGVNHNYNWFDPGHHCDAAGAVPCDNNGHGTHTMGTMVGEDGANQVGVAPAARWVAAMGCGSSTCADSDLLGSGQWTLAPTDTSGANPRTDKRPHIVNNSWGAANGSAIDPWYDEIVSGWTASGIFGIFSNGNSGPGCDTTGSPADGPHSYGIGGFQSNGSVYNNSSRGPGVNGEIRPAISAPAVAVRSSVPGNSYASFTGTSMAAPHVGGSVALLWSLAPALVGDIDGTRALLDSTAVDVNDVSCGGTPADNNVWGEGKLDVLAAATQAPVGDTGTLSGTVTDSADGDPVAGATVTVAGSVDRTLTTGADGTYSALLPVGDYDVSVAAFGYAGETADATVAVDATTTVDFALDGAAQYSVNGIVSDPRGDPVAGATVTLGGTPLPPATTDSSGVFTFADVPAGQYTLTVTPSSACADAVSQALTVDGNEVVAITLPDKTDAYGYRCYTTAGTWVPGTTKLALTGDDASQQITLPFPVTFYGQRYESAFVSTNGHLNFLAAATAFGNVNIPAPAVPNAAVYAFWDDLNIDATAGVYTGTATVGGRQALVVEWRNAAIFGATGLRIDAEALVFASGEVQLNYRGIDPAQDRERGNSTTVGIENQTGTVATKFSFNTTSLADGRSVVFDLPPNGFVSGTVTDGNDGQPVSGATITVTDSAGAVVRTLSTDGQGNYGSQLWLGTYTVTASKTNYVTGSRSVTIASDGQSVDADFVLATARGEVSPSGLDWLLPQGQRRNAVLTLRNTGTVPMTYTIGETGGQQVERQGVSETSAQIASRDPLAKSAAVELTARQRAAVVPMAPGDVLAEWPASGVTVPWGVGVSSNLWISDPDPASVNNTEFAAAGTPTGRVWDADWAGTWNGDMSKDTRSGLMCQVNVGGDNGIHCWDEATGDVGYSLTGAPWSAISQRGLAYREDDDTFYIGGWNEGVIYHVAGDSHPTPGETLGSCTPEEEGIAGLAWNGTAGSLWMTGSTADNTIYQLNPETCATLSTLGFPETEAFSGAGLEMAADGNLWMTSQTSGTAYLVDSGVPAVSDVPWLTESPTSGTVAPGGTARVTVSVDTAGLESGIYEANVLIATNSGRQATVQVPVRLVVSGYWTGVNAGGASYRDRSGITWRADKQYAAGSYGWVGTSTTKAANAGVDFRGTEDDALYRDQRIGMDAYTFDAVPAGTYEVTLDFAELNRSPRVDWRRFDVSVNDQWALVGHDTAQEVGGQAADRHTYRVEVPAGGGQISVEFFDRRGYQPSIINSIAVVHRPDL